MSLNLFCHEVPFWSKGDPKYQFLSNFHTCFIQHKGLIFPSCEHAYVWEKLADKSEYLCLCLQDVSPAALKKACEHIRVREDWLRVRAEVMMDLTAKKYEQNPGLKKKLVSLHLQGSLFVHDIPWPDEYWGRFNGKGLNMQGIILDQYCFELVVKKTISAELSCYFENVPAYVAQQLILRLRDFVKEFKESRFTSEPVTELETLFVSCYLELTRLNLSVFNADAWCDAFFNKGLSFSYEMLKQKISASQDSLF